MKLVKILALGVVTTAFPYAAAQAQSADGAAEQQGTDAESGLADIIVTANRRSESLQDVSTSIGVATDEDLASRGIESLRDLAESTAGLTITPSVGTNTVFIRGVGGGGRNIGFGTRAGIYVDGVYVGQSASIDQSAADVDRIEVLRGPQGATFGRNSVSGAISIISKAPDYDLGGNLLAEIGNNDHLEIRGGLNVPLVTDKIAFRVSGVRRKRDGFTLNLANSENLGNIDRTGFRGQLRFDITPELDLTLSGDYTVDRTRLILGEDDSNLTGTGPTSNPAPFVVNFNRATFQRNEFYGFSATLNYDVGGGNTITAVSAIRRANTDRLSDNDYSVLDIIYTTFDDHFEQFSQEVRLASSGNNKIDYVFGAYYLNERATSSRVANLGTNIALLSPTLTPNSEVPVSGDIRTTSFAVFGNVDFRISDRLVFTAGGRYTSEKVDLLNYSVDGRVAPPFRIAYIANFADAQRTKRFDPTVSLNFALSDDANVYLKYSQGFKSGGYNIDFVNALQFAQAGIAFKPERAQSYEAGLKTELFDRRGRVNISAFIMDFSNYQINQFVDLGGGQTAISLRNAAAARTYGAELEARFNVTKSLALGSNLAFTKAQFQDFPNGGGNGVNLKDNFLPHAPKFTSSVYFDFRHDLGSSGLMATVFGEHNHRSSSFSGPENLARQQIGSRDIVNFRIGIGSANGAWSLQAFVDNAFNQKYLLTRERDFFGTLIVERGTPRTYGLTARLSF